MVRRVPKIPPIVLAVGVLVLTPCLLAAQGGQSPRSGPHARSPRAADLDTSIETLIDFDDVVARCYFLFSLPLRDRYAHLGVRFSGPDELSGGAILEFEECTASVASGFSVPNSFSFAGEPIYLNGGSADGPATMTFDPPVNEVRILTLGGHGLTRMECFDASGDPVGSDAEGGQGVVRLLLVRASGIRTCVLSSEGEARVQFDDLRFVRDGGVTLDFETEDDFETPLVDGQSISTPFEFGRLVEINGFGPHTYGTAIFDSCPNGPNAAGSDPDLLVDQGNLLILQENPAQTVPGFYDSPDDAQLGGLMVFDFKEPVQLASVDLVDICPGPPAQDVTLTLRDQGGNTRTYFVPGGWTRDLFVHGPPGVGTLFLLTLSPQPGASAAATATATETAGFAPTDVVRLEVLFDGSGALDNLVYLPGTLATPRSKARPR